MTYRTPTRRNRRPSIASQIGAWLGVVAAAVFVMAWGIGVGATL